MLVDEKVLERSDAQYDVVIVGAGVAGIAVAEALIPLRRRVLLLEAGGKGADAVAREDCAGTLSDASTHPALDLYRVRALGGTSRIWGGRCLKFDPIDFVGREWVPNSGWPISFGAIASYYPAALALTEAGQDAFDPADSLPDQQAELFAGLDGAMVRTTLERFSRPTDFWRRAGPALTGAKTTHVLSEAVATRILLATKGDVVDGLEVVLRSGRRTIIRAAHYVIAGGGLETTRLLLASNDIKQEGLGNAGDALGRYYMSHLCTTASILRPHHSPSGSSWNYARDAEGIYVRRRLAFTEAAQQRHQLLNTTFRTHYSNPGDPAHESAILSAMFLAKSFVQREYAAKFSEGRVSLASYGRHIGNMVRQPGSLLRFGASWTRDRLLSSRKLPSVVLPPSRSGIALEFHAEQSPNKASRVTLGPGLDRFGMRRLHVDWRLDTRDIESLQRAHGLLADVLAERGVGRLSYRLPDIADRCRRLGIVGGHQIGTTRMSSCERDGVVDEDCRVHGIWNLHIAGASVFPTSGQANPTLTVAALALRLADRLKSVLSKQAAIAS